MPDDHPSNLSPANPDDLKFSLRQALLFAGRKRFDHAREFMADLTADHLIAAMTLSGYVIMKKPPAPDHSIGSPPEYEARLRATKRLTE